MEAPAWLSSKDDILKWLRDYDANEDSFNGGLEERLRRRFQEEKLATHGDIEEVLRWKFAEMKGRLKRDLNLLSTVDPDLIEDATKKAFALSGDSAKLGQLRRIKGVGGAVASVILTFYDPDNYGVIDIHSWRELFGGKKQVFNKSDFIRFTQTLRQLARTHSLSARDVEKALFRKNRVEPN
jgi:hypothetical protein